MRRVADHSLWLGHLGAARDLVGLLDRGIMAVVDLAGNESPIMLSRDLISCRLPLKDGGGNPPWLLRLAVGTVANLIRDQIPTLVFCGAGMSRTPAIAGAALA